MYNLLIIYKTNIITGSLAKMNGTSGVNPENFKDIMCHGKNINFIPVFILILYINF